MTWVWVNTFSGMNIHLPAILGFTRYQGFDPSPHVVWISLGCSASVFSPFDIQCTHRGTMLRLARCLRDPCGDTWSDFVMGNSCTHEIHGPRININHLQVKCTACPHTKSDLVLGLPQYHGSPDFCGRKLLTSRRVAGNSIQRSKIRTKLIQGRFFFLIPRFPSFNVIGTPKSMKHLADALDISKISTKSCEAHGGVSDWFFHIFPYIFPLKKRSRHRNVI